jgi:mono/diheme cytochrome c family protein
VITPRTLRVIAASLAAIAIAATSLRAVDVRASENLTKQEKQQLFLRGAQLWPVYCNTCHNARPASEFSPVEWNTIMMHMRTQANLPAHDATAILEYLKDSR